MESKRKLKKRILPQEFQNYKECSKQQITENKNVIKHVEVVNKTNDEGFCHACPVGGICTYESVRTLRVCCQDNYESTLYKRTYLSDFDKK